MKKETKWLGVILISTLILLFGSMFLFTRSNSSKAVAGATVSQIDYSKGQKIGSDSAKVKVVEFSDFQCQACLVAKPFIKKLRIIYPDQVQFIYRYLPTPGHLYGRQTAYLAEAAGEQGKFWEMHDKLFETQTQWTALAEADAADFFLGLARELDLDENKVKQALEEDIFKSKIDDDIAEADRIEIDSVPTFFVNGRKLNLKSFDDLNTAVVEELKKNE
ncbi:DsbA family protein [Patescibacteria group bacterium]|nr:DsbA family protein [Patescibacteria group bacterium]